MLYPLLDPNPVKSPLELAAYFTAITIGIASAVSLKWTITLVVMLVIALIVLKVFYLLVNTLLGMQLPRASFSEGNELSTLEIHLDAEMKDLSEYEELVHYSYADDIHKYHFASQNLAKLDEIRQRYAISSAKFVQLQR